LAKKTFTHQLQLSQRSIIRSPDDRREVSRPGESISYVELPVELFSTLRYFAHYFTTFYRGWKSSKFCLDFRLSRIWRALDWKRSDIPGNIKYLFGAPVIAVSSHNWI